MVYGWIEIIGKMVAASFTFTKRILVITVATACLVIGGWNDMGFGPALVNGADSGGTGGDTSGDGGGDAGDTGDAGDSGDTGDTGDTGDPGADPGDDPADDDPADEDPADEDPSDEEPEDEEPEDADADADDDEDADSEDDIVDDGDHDDDSEPDIEVILAEKELAVKRRVALDGLCKLDTLKKGLKRIGLIADFSPLNDRLSNVYGRNIHRLGGPEPGQMKRPGGNTSSRLHLPNAGRPKYEKGDTYVYSDGTWEEVVSSNQERVEWVNHRGNGSVGSPDFTYKRSRWQTSTRIGTRTFQQTSYIWDKPTDTLWPLAQKNKTRFDEEGRWVGKDGIERKYDSFWRCDVEGEERVNVAAGVFDTWRIRCARYPDSFSYPKSRAREYRTWYYAPSIEHWVLLERDNLGYRPDERKELVAILPNLKSLSANPQAIVQVQQQFQEVLENNARNQQDMWMAAAGDIAVTLEPHATFQNKDGIYCRQYTQEIQAPGFNRKYAGIGCRSPEGSWYVPRR